MPLLGLHRECRDARQRVRCAPLEERCPVPLPGLHRECRDVRVRLWCDPSSASRLAWGAAVDGCAPLRSRYSAGRGRRRRTCFQKPQKLGQKLSQDDPFAAVRRFAPATTRVEGGDGQDLRQVLLGDTLEGYEPGALTALPA